MLLLLLLLLMILGQQLIAANPYNLPKLSVGKWFHLPPRMKFWVAANLASFSLMGGEFVPEKVAAKCGETIDDPPEMAEKRKRVNHKGTKDTKGKDKTIPPQRCRGRGDTQRKN